jgi:uncharacterized protein YkwD
LILARRGRFIKSRYGASPEQGKDAVLDRSYGAHVPSATAALPARAGLIATLVVSLAAFLFAAPADGGARSASALLAPADACANATDPSAAPAAQRRAVTCLINWARRQDRRAKLSPSSSLRTAAGLKGQKVADCGQLSHTPCGTDVVGPLKASGYRYASFGENLYVGAWGVVSARDVVNAWLQSAGHRENMLRPYFRDVGVSFVRAQGIVNSGPEIVWVATFGSRR